MYRYFSALLLASTPLLGSNCCDPADESSYPYGINPPLVSNCGYSFGFRADYLYWKPYIEDNSFATIQDAGYYGQTSTSRIPSIPSSATVREVNLPNQWQSGLRVGIDIGMPENEWCMVLDWTHLFNRHQNKTVGITPPVSDFTNPVVTLSYLQDPAFYQSFAQASSSGAQAPSVMFGSSATGRSKINYDVIDLVFAREFYVGHQVTFAPYGGLKALFLRQKLDASAAASFASISISDGSTISTIQTLQEVDLYSSFNGVGIEAGFRSTWDVHCNFGLYGDLSTAILYGKSKSSLSGNLSGTATPADPIDFPGYGTPSPVDYSTWRNVNTLKATLDLAFGIEWKSTFFSDSNLLTLRAGWENHILFRQNTFIAMDIDYESIQVAHASTKQRLTDLSFQGLVVSASLQY